MLGQDGPQGKGKGKGKGKGQGKGQRWGRCANVGALHPHERALSAP